MSHAVIVDAVRSPRGRGNAKGSLAAVKPVDLLAAQFAGLIARNGFDTAEIADVVVGCVTQTGDQGTNIGKLGLIAAGWDDRVPAVTVNRFCASGLSAVNLAALRAVAEDGLAVGAGVEMMSRVPMAADHGPLTHDPAFQQRAGVVPIGLAADAVATLEGFGRAACDAFAARSQERALAAQAAGHFSSILPVKDAAGTILLAADETPRPGNTAGQLAGMAPAFAEMGAKYGIDALLCSRYGLETIAHVHHAGNAPASADGAAAVLLASPAAANRLGLPVRARLLAAAEVSTDRTLALTAAVDASRLALKRAGLGTADIDLFEVNEAFAGPMLHYLRHLEIDADRLNVNGGAIALGHAMGATGAILVGMALDELERRDGRRALVAACGAAGLAAALIIERG